jgi:hypothetical protein
VANCQRERYHPMKGDIMPTGADLLGEFEEHSPAGIRAMRAGARLSRLRASGQLMC